METNAQPQANEITQPEVNEQPTAQETTIKETPDFIRIKRNHNWEDVPYDEAVTNIQKGKNYDKIYTELQTLKNDETLKWLDEVAKEYGVSRKELKEKWATELNETKVNEYAEQQNISPELAKELLETKKERELYKNQILTIEQQKKQQELIDNQIKEFHEAYPNVKDEEIPDEVIGFSQEKGIPLKIAYDTYLAKKLQERVKELEEKLNVKTTNEENANSSMGSAQTSGSTFPEELTAESIKAMDRKTRQANMPRILEWYNKQKK